MAMRVRFPYRMKTCLAERYKSDTGRHEKLVAANAVELIAAAPLRMTGFYTTVRTGDVL
jgi:hypothetical protein